MTERLQKILSCHGLCSRREAENWILAGRVSVNGQVAALGMSADEAADTILVDGKPLQKTDRRVYILLHKPRGYVTTLSDEKGRKNAASLVADCGTRVYPVGRLDMDSEGLLLFTNDGEFANTMMHPSHQVEKCYETWVTGYAPGREKSLLQPIVLDGREIARPGVRLLQSDGDRAKILITIHEGRNRQVRRMCQAAGMTVTRLKRVREGSLELGKLPMGAWRYLTEEEVRLLMK